MWNGGISPQPLLSYKWFLENLLGLGQTALIDGQIDVGGFTQGTCWWDGWEGMVPALGDPWACEQPSLPEGPNELEEEG